MVDELDEYDADSVESAVDDDRSQAVGSNLLAGLVDIDGEEDGQSATPGSAMQTDPVVGFLLKIALSVIVVLLATTGALVYYLNTLNRAPRTSAERDIITWETATQETPKSADAWAQLAYAYSVAGRHDEALSAVAQGIKRTKQPVLSLVRADVLRVAGRLAEAKDAYDTAEKDIKQAGEEVAAKRRKLRVTMDIPDEALERVYSGRAMVLYDMGDLSGAIKDMELALKESPQQSALWVKLGDFYQENKQNNKAEQAYNEALKFVPDYDEALAGLKALGKEPK